jgi:molybdopterin molybdotransferase
MPEFLQLLAPGDALTLLMAALREAQGAAYRIASEDVDVQQALGRVTVEAVLAPHPLPSFPRSTVDGYAVRAADTYGASEGLPAYLGVVGEVPMGSSPGFDIRASECALIHTGGMLPESSDAVVMVEHTQSVRGEEVEILKAVAVGENVLNIGEDVSSGQEVISSGTRLRPAEIGGLVGLGIRRIGVARRPRVGIISSGDEVVSLETEIQPGQVRDINAYSLSALVQEAGGEAVYYGIVPDAADALEATAAGALKACDLVVITAGSSASTRDLTSTVINRLGEPGVLVHGVNVRPGKPTILAVCHGKAMIGLPGNPVSALVIAGLFVVPVIQELQGMRVDRPVAALSAQLSLNLASQAGREDWIPVRILRGEHGYEAEPVFGKSNLIFTLARADGLLRIPANATGLSAGEIVEVILL